jgi:hypothetical protein
MIGGAIKDWRWFDTFTVDKDISLWWYYFFQCLAVRSMSRFYCNYWFELDLSWGFMLLLLDQRKLIMAMLISRMAAILIIPNQFNLRVHIAFPLLFANLILPHFLLTLLLSTAVWWFISLLLLLLVSLVLRIKQFL